MPSNIRRKSKVQDISQKKSLPVTAGIFLNYELRITIKPFVTLYASRFYFAISLFIYYDLLSYLVKAIIKDHRIHTVGYWPEVNHLVQRTGYFHLCFFIDLYSKTIIDADVERFRRSCGDGNIELSIVGNRVYVDG